MIGLLRAELRKLTSVRTTWIVVALVAGYGALGVFFGIAFGGTMGQMNLGSPTYQMTLLRPDVGVFALLLGTVLATGEFRHGTIVAAVLATPARWPLWAPKALTAAVGAVLLTLATLAVQAGLAVPWLAVMGEPLSVSVAEVARNAARTAGYAALMGVLGVGVGLLLRNQVAAIITVVVATVVVSPTLLMLAPEVGWYTPAGLETVMLSGEVMMPLPGGSASFGAGAAAGLLAAYAAAATAAGGVVLARRDIG